MLFAVLSVHIDGPAFDHQNKAELDSPESSWGWHWTPDAAFCARAATLLADDVASSLVLRSEQKALTAANALTDGASSRRVVNIAKYEPADEAGSADTQAVLVLTEGDSAMSLAMAGRAVRGSARMGVFCLKGKPPNPRGKSIVKIVDNKVLSNVAKILGLEYGRVFTTEADLRRRLNYRFVELFADQDYDGGHIVGLIINWLHACWPSLLELRPDFVRRFASPVIIVRGPGAAAEPLHSFLSQVEFKAWVGRAGPTALAAGRVQYFKGLGSHTQAMGRTYFTHPERYVLTLEYAAARDGPALVTFFDPDHAAARKELVGCTPRADALDYAALTAPLEEFLHLEVLPFFRDDVLRSLPWPDGLKRTQRKLLWACRLVAKPGVARKLTDLAMKCGEVSNYHHGEASLYATLVGMAQAHAGTNNINMFMCSSMMGSRLTKRNKYSAPRYLTTGPSPILPLLLRPEDDPILVYRIEDGDHAVEPVTFYPVVPLDVLNGTDGVGTGWKTIIPAFHLTDIIAALRGRLAGMFVALNAMRAVARFILFTILYPFKLVASAWTFFYLYFISCCLVQGLRTGRCSQTLRCRGMTA